jgi:hypothetical protein
MSVRILGIVIVAAATFPLLPGCVREHERVVEKQPVIEKERVVERPTIVEHHDVERQVVKEPVPVVVPAPAAERQQRDEVIIRHND